MDFLENLYFENPDDDEASDGDKLKDEAYGKLVTWIIDMTENGCEKNALMDEMLQGEETMRNSGAESDTSRSPNLSSQQVSIDSIGSSSSLRSSLAIDSKSICTIPETKYLGRAQSEDYDSVRPKTKGVLLKQFSVACDSRSGPKALNRDKSLEFSKPKDLNKSSDSYKSGEISKSLKSIKSTTNLKDIEPNLKVKETELLKARYQNIISKRNEQNTLVKQSSEPESFKNKLNPKPKMTQATKSFDNFLDVPKPFNPPYTYNRESSDESSSSKKDLLSTSSKSIESDSSRSGTSPRPRNKRTISEEGFRKKEKYRMSLRHKPVKSFENFIDESSKLTKYSTSRQTTISVEDEDGVIIENISQGHEEMIPLRPISADDENLEKFDINFETAKCRQKRAPLGILSRSVGNIKEKTSKLKFLVRRKSNSLMSIKTQEVNECSAADIKAVSNEDVILDNTLLDGNINDILFAIDTLWPTK